jgi:hypothetical protein
MAQFRKDTHQFLGDGKTIFETVMLADQYGNIVGAANPSGTAVDAFGRARTSQPYTLFDSFHRYRDNGKKSTANTANATFVFNSNTSTIDCTVDTTSGQYCYRESNKVFAYQPGKSLQVLTTFVMNPAKTNLRQRVGYFSSENGFFLERNGTSVYFVKRSKATGVVVDTQVAQANWNIDKLDGTGPSLITLDLDNPQILFTDIEWLGVGSVRMGFVINGKFIHCHTFHHANSSTSPKGAYIQTACLPVRSEIENIGTTTSNSTYKEICSTVVSEGGYTLSGKQFSAGIPVTTPKDLPTAGTFVPIIAIRLKSDSLDSIAVPKGISVLGSGNNTRLRYKVVTGNNIVLTGASWVNAASDSSVEYDISSSSYSGGTDVFQGYISVTNQATVPVTLVDDVLKYQLSRNSFTSNGHIFMIVATGAANGDDCLASMDWEEVS